MSLRSFHIVFVTMATLLFAFLAVWGFVISADKSTTVKVLGWIGCAGAVLMPVYGVCFYRKFRKIDR